MCDDSDDDRHEYDHEMLLELATTAVAPILAAFA
eukprot:CAMPEP_0202019872 /NCGR_PEP_ID=MMETSP0905-20130828/43091_1 /ASSEMBLY_ACC=CAM_ASM_000554 /TAXON_ID=420261 /ORGANISM="Thalassiosira antarctica, Strain CCMP982" /LENGTH=33 /DNA_ID= /DNA_START= /DNA_END= /DNA_ORIENTATION=